MSFKSIEELFGKSKLSESDVDKAAPTVYLDTGIPQLNSILAGDPTKGLACGQVAEIAGESQSGKTMLATRMMISAQKQGGFALFYDFERAYHIDLATKQGLDTSKEKFFYKKAKYFEDSLDDCIYRAKLLRDSGLISADAPIVAIFDSFAAMVPKSMAADSKGKEKSFADYTMSDMTSLARQASLVLKAYTIDVNDLNICSVFLNQLADNLAATTMKGTPKKTKGGNSLPFYASTRLFIRSTNAVEDKAIVGKEMILSTTKNRHRKPFEKVTVDFNFNADGTGDFDVMRTYIAYLKSIGAIESAGAWITFNGERYQGNTKFEEALAKDPAALDKLIQCQLDYMEKVGETPLLVDEALDSDDSDD